MTMVGLSEKTLVSSLEILDLVLPEGTLKMLETERILLSCLEGVRKGVCGFDALCEEAHEADADLRPSRHHTHVLCHRLG